MANIKEAVLQFLTVDYGSGCGSDGYGCGYGCGSDGSGYGASYDGYGCGSGGCGSEYGSGYGYGASSDGYGSSSDGYGCGSGDRGSEYGSGYGYGSSSDGVKEFNKDPVHMIDGIATIIKAVFGNYAKGYILNKDLTLSPCYIAKEGWYFAHGDTLADAVRDAHGKSFESMSEDERIEEF